MIRFWKDYDGGLFSRLIDKQTTYRVLVLGKIVIAWERKNPNRKPGLLDS